MICVNCNSKTPNDYQFCQHCLYNLHSPEEKQRIPMTEWERLKLSFYRNNKEWENNIRMRKRVKNRDGKYIYVSGNREMPTSPRRIWAKPKI